MAAGIADGRWVLMLAACCCPARVAAQPELPELQAHGELAIRSVTPSSAEVGRFERLELRVDLSATYDNPFDPDQVDLRAVFTDPEDVKVEAAGFFCQPYRIRGGYADDRVPLLDEDGEPTWLVRFAPSAVGEWSYRVRARDRSGEVVSPEQRFTVVASDSPGFIRVSRRDPRYFAFDDGTPFVAIGQNLQNDWPRYDHSRRLAEAGCNAVRAWTFCHWTWLEWSHRDDIDWAGPGHYMRSYGGSGVYNQRIAWIADLHLEQWERDGLHAMMCLGNGSELSSPDRYDSWGGHPYNVVNGGFLDSGAGFWTDERARKMVRNRLRYIVARYGYSPSVWAWELWNELGRETDEVVAWHAEMAEYLHRVDPHRHLVTTSHWGTNAEANPGTWAVPGIDFTQTHNYAGAGTIRQRTARMLELSPKPHIIGEGGGPNPGPESAIDPDGIEFHNSLWAAVFSGAAGTTLPWWWRERIEPKDLFQHYSAIAGFAASVPWTSGAWRPIDPGDVTVVAATAREGFSPTLFVALGVGWGQKAPRSEFAVLPDGTVEHLDELSPVLFGTGRADWANPPTFVVDYPTDGRFIVRISEASHGVLEVVLDGEVAARDDSFNVPREGCNRDVGIDVPAGRHRVTLHNRGSDWLRVSHVLLTDYRDRSRYPDAEVLGLRSEAAGALWIRHRLNEWPYRALNLLPQPERDLTVMVRDMPDGRYRVEWLDPYARSALRGQNVAVEKGALALDLPELQTDLACVLRRE